MNRLPPKILLRLFRWFCKPELADHIEGDLIEVYRQRLQTRSSFVANCKFFIDVLLLFRPGIIRSRERIDTLNSFDMFGNYAKIALRVFRRDKMYSAINVFGLALGFTCCILIFLFISDELSYDKFHKDKERIYRVASAYMRQGVWEPYASNSWKTSELIKANYPEIEEMVRIMNDNDMFEYEGKRIYEYRTAWVDGNFFDVFNFPLVAGNPSDALKGTNKVVITEAIAKKYFGSENPIGKVFKVRDGEFQLQVSGVMKEMPTNSHFHFDFLISNETLKQTSSEALFTNVGWDSQHMYVKLKRNADPARMEATFPSFADKNLEFMNSKNFKLFLQPLESIHLKSNLGLEFEDNGSMSRVNTFSVIAIFILIIACVNYMNLTTARSMRRAKEVRMRKVLGAKKGDLLNQFLTESFLMTVFAIVFAIALSLVLLPEFNDFAGKQISRHVFLSWEVLLSIVVSIVVLCLLSGFYPSLILSSFNTQNSLKSGAGAAPARFTVRKGLVVLQFAISIGLIAASVVIFKQWEYLRNKSLGINKDMVIAVPLQTMERSQVNVFRNELLADASVRKAGFSNMRMPGWIGSSTSYTAQDVDTEREVNKTMKIIRVDYNFLPTIEAEMVSGRNFSTSFPADSSTSIIINESAAKQLNWKGGVGKWMEFGEKRYNVVGIVKDFHFESLHREIPPTIFIPSSDWLNWAYVKIDGANVAGTLRHVESTYAKFVKNRDFSHTFLNEDIDQQYQGEEKFTQVFTVFTFLAIVIACLGTFGLISFTAERKSKEIGIRKVLGASAGDVSVLLVKEFVVLLLVASLIAWPVTWYFLKDWIDGFIYRTTVGVDPFIIATVLAAVIVMLTTGFRAMKAALANPIKALRVE
jgi:putative ABC transport system permease protein